MIKEIKYFIFFLATILFIFFSIKYYISDQNIKKTFRNLSLIDENINSYEKKIIIIPSDTNDIVVYLNNENKKNKKNYYFWDLLKNVD